VQSLPSSRSPNARPPSPTDSSNSDQISTRWFPYERLDEISTRLNPMQWVQNKKKSNLESESNMVATRTGSTTLRRCSRAAASGQRRPMTLAVLMTAPSDLVYVEEGGTDGIDVATLTSKPIASMPPIPTRRHRGRLPVAAAGSGKP
jgi:hypothetical protein